MIEKKLWKERLFSLEFWCKAFPWVWLVLAFTVTMGMLWTHGRAYIDSDIASDLMLANLLNETGTLVTDQWWYSTELRVVYLQMFWRIGLLLFPNDWYSAQMFGQVLWMLALIAAYFYVGRGLHLRGCGVWGAAALCCPFGGWYLWYGPFGGAYLPYMVYTLLLFGLIVHLLQPASRVRRIMQWGLLAVLSLIFGLTSIKILMAVGLPMIVAVAAFYAYNLHKGRFEAAHQYLPVLPAALVCFGGLAVGYVLNSKVLATMFSYGDFNQSVWGPLSPNALLKVFGDFLSLFGFAQDNYFHFDIPLFSLNGVLHVCSLGLALALVCSVIYLLYRLAGLTPLHCLTVLYFVAAVLVQGCIFAFTAASFADAKYWLTIAPMIFVLMELAFQTFPFRLSLMRPVVGMAFCLLVLGSSVSSWGIFFSHPPHGDPELYQICNVLLEHGYTKGFTTFWSGDVLTEWSNGEIEVWVTKKSSTLGLNKWLQKVDHETPPEGPVFLLASDYELETQNISALLEQNETLEVPSEKYNVILFADYASLASQLEALGG